MASYRTLENFYRADLRRADSQERDFGLWWREPEGGTLHRAAWVRATGEFYLAELGTPTPAVHVLAAGLGERELERQLAGWAEVCSGQAGSLQWLRERVGAAERRSRPRLRRSRTGQSGSVASPVAG
ncbi:MAG: hypothetical protein NVSMB51_11860 [Solirubrobacteraceae bacterium]